MEKSVNNYEELMTILSSSKKTTEFDELVVVGDCDVRNNIIFSLSNHKDWENDCYITSSNNIWYLFKRTDNRYKVSINDGDSDIFNDIILTINY